MPNAEIEKLRKPVIAAEKKLKEARDSLQRAHIKHVYGRDAELTGLTWEHDSARIIKQRQAAVDKADKAYDKAEATFLKKEEEIKARAGGRRTRRRTRKTRSTRALTARRR